MCICQCVIVLYHNVTCTGAYFQMNKVCQTLDALRYVFFLQGKSICVVEFCHALHNPFKSGQSNFKPEVAT